MGAPNPDVTALVNQLALQYWTVTNRPSMTAVVAAVTSQLSRLGGEINSAVIAFAQTQVTAVFTAEEALEEAHGGPAVVIPPGGNTPSLADVRAYYSSSVGQVVPGAGTIIDFQTLETDTDSAVTTGANWHFTCPVDKAGTYNVFIAMNANALNALQIFLNGVLLKTITTNQASATGIGAVAVDLVAGNVINFRTVAAGTLLGGVTSNWVRIFSN